MWQQISRKIWWQIRKNLGTWLQDWGGIGWKGMVFFSQFSGTKPVNIASWNAEMWSLVLRQQNEWFSCGNPFPSFSVYFSWIGAQQSQDLALLDLFWYPKIRCLSACSLQKIPFLWYLPFWHKLLWWSYPKLPPVSPVAHYEGETERHWIGGQHSFQWVGDWELSGVGDPFRDIE